IRFEPRTRIPALPRLWPDRHFRMTTAFSPILSIGTPRAPLHDSIESPPDSPATRHRILPPPLASGGLNVDWDGVVLSGCVDAHRHKRPLSDHGSGSYEPNRCPDNSSP